MAEMKGIARNLFWDDEDEILNPENFAVHPGPFLRTYVLKEHDISVSALADRLMVARPGLNNMLMGKRAMTPGLALKIERAIGYPAVVLCQMQTTYDLAHDRVELEPDILRIEPLRVLV